MNSGVDSVISYSNFVNCDTWVSCGLTVSPALCTHQCIPTVTHTVTYTRLPPHSSLEYDPSRYGLYLHDEAALPQQDKLWDYLDQKFTSGYQDTLVLHLDPSPLRAELAGEEGRCVQN